RAARPVAGGVGDPRGAAGRARDRSRPDGQHRPAGIAFGWLPLARRPSPRLGDGLGLRWLAHASTRGGGPAKLSPRTFGGRKPCAAFYVRSCSPPPWPWPASRPPSPI